MKKYVTRLEGQIVLMSQPDYDPKTAPPFEFKKIADKALSSAIGSSPKPKLLIEEGSRSRRASISSKVKGDDDSFTDEEGDSF